MHKSDQCVDSTMTGPCTWVGTTLYPGDQRGCWVAILYCEDSHGTGGATILHQRVDPDRVQELVDEGIPYGRAEHIVLGEIWQEHHDRAVTSARTRAERRQRQAERGYDVAPLQSWERALLAA